MARPRKDQGDCAEQRIKDAFWALLEQNDLKDITVSMITSKANCNRGTILTITIIHSKSLSIQS